MHGSYGQYCPLALAAEVLGERWNILLISRLGEGFTHFNEIHRGLPGMSATLLSNRLEQLDRAGIVQRQRAKNGKGFSYSLTSAGDALIPVIDQLGVWGHHWARDMTDEDLNPVFLLWSMHLRMDTARMPERRTVLEFRFSGAPKDCNRFWLVKESGELEMCLKDPGLEVDLSVKSDLRCFIEAWRGFRDFDEEIEAGNIQLAGPEKLRKQFPGWLQLSLFAHHPRLRPGRERSLAQAARSRS